MPITDCPFFSISTGHPSRPMLPIEVINPATKKNIFLYGLIDTGADRCALPAELADVLGHSLLAGQVVNIDTGNGMTKAYSHTTRINIFSLPNPSEPVYTIHDTQVDFMPNLTTVLLGVKGFLSKFILSIDYPNRTFSIKKSR